MKAAIVRDRTGVYATVPKEEIKVVNGYDCFHVPTSMIWDLLDDIDEMDAKGEKMNVIIHHDDAPQEIRKVYCSVAEIGGDALVMLAPVIILPELNDSPALEHDPTRS